MQCDVDLQVALLAKTSVLSSTLLFFLTQYVLRISHIYEWVKHINIETRIGRLLKGVLDLCPFFLTAHLFGGMWYFLAIKRETRCWLKACRNVKECYPATEYDLFCGNLNEFRMHNISIINRLCPKSIKCIGVALRYIS
ncbi:PREDICTED: probable cyclic nucleotide-gated ion channel 3-like [Fragaria vesca subsp. vesca]